MKNFLKYFTASLLFIAIVLGGYFAYSEVSFGKVADKELKPLVTQTVNRRQEVATFTPIVKIEDKVVGKTSFFPASLLITYKGDNLLVLVNKRIRLPQDYVPGDMISLNGLVTTSAGSFYLRTEAAFQLKKMFDEASANGLNLSVISAYRSYNYQRSVFNNWVKLAGQKQAESFSAKPGHSQHQLGTAVDLAAKNSSTPFSGSFGDTPEGKWLASNAYKFGYVLSYPKGKEAVTGYSYEPWHWRYIGVANAQKMTDSGLILEEFLTKFGTW